MHVNALCMKLLLNWALCLFYRSDGENDGKNQIVIDVADMDKMKQDIMSELKKEMNKMKQDIIDGLLFIFLYFKIFFKLYITIFM